MQENFYLYIIYTYQNKFHSLGITSDLKRRMNILKNKTKNDIKLVYWETFDKSSEAEDREIFLSDFPPEIIHKLVKESNPSLIDLSYLQ